MTVLFPSFHAAMVPPFCAVQKVRSESMDTVLLPIPRYPILWVAYGYSLAFGEGNNFFGNINGLMLKNIELTAVMGSIYQYIHVAFQGSFACITVGLIVGALAERIRFSAVLIFVVVWLTLSYIPIAHMEIGRASCRERV